MILVRPDGYIAWAKRRHTSQIDLTAALAPMVRSDR